MRDWELGAEDPYTLRIAADARTCQPNYLDDQIWELRLAGGEPPALAIETTYGLRARSMRIFPAFQVAEQYRMDPASFAEPPRVRRFLPNYLLVQCQPFPGVAVVAEYWVPESDRLAGRFTISSLEPESIELQLLLHALLRPDETGVAMAAISREGAAILSGRTANLVPVVFLAGGASPAISAFPALRVNLSLQPGRSDSLIWSHAGLRELQESFLSARATAAGAWDAQIAHLERANAGLLELQTGDPDWDVALAMSQKASLGCYLGPTRHLPHPSFVLSRSPDRGFSLRADGRDYDWAWNGQGALEAYLNLLQILPAAPDLAKGVLLNFLSVQDPEGAIDLKPGLGGQRNGALCVPLLATLAWRIYQWTEDQPFLEGVAPGLLRFFERWFSPRHDRDQDGHPEWSHTLQAGLEDWPSFERGLPWAQGLDINLAETPDLAAYLYREAASLILIQRTLGLDEAIADLQRRQQDLQAALDSSWSRNPAGYRHLDAELHTSTSGKRLALRRGEFELALQADFDPPVRVLVRIRSSAAAMPNFKVEIRGVASNRRRRVLRLGRGDFQCYPGWATVSTEVAFARIERIQVSGLSKRSTTELRIADYARLDLTSLLPLWAGAPDPSKAAQLLESSLLAEPHFWRAHGIPACPASDPAYAGQGAARVRMIWNAMLGEGLVDYGYLPQAADLLARLLTASIGALRRDKAFREAYHPDSVEAFGERDHLAGVAPLSLLFYTLGLRLISPRKVVLRGRNPYPHPVRLRWRGLEIRWKGDSAVVRFQDGAEVEVQGETPQVIEQEPVGLQGRQRRDQG